MAEQVFINQSQQKPITPFDYGRFYPYYSKPKIVPILKKIIGTLTALCLALFLVSNFIGIMLDNSAKKTYINILWRSLFPYLYPFIAFYVIYRSFQRVNHDSQKYSASILYAIIIISYNVFWIIALLNFQDTDTKAIQKNISVFQFWKVLNLLEMILAAIVVSLLMVLIIVRPKIDQEKSKKIQGEIRKKAIANLEGKDYEMNLTGLE